MLREVKPRNARSARALKERAPRDHEHAKKALFLKSSTCSALVNEISTDLHSLKKPHAVRFSKKNEGIHPFEDPSSLEFFAQKNDTSHLVLSSHSKKRPHALTFVRCFDSKVLDMLEFTVVQETARTASQFSSANGKSVRTGLKPLLSFSGAGFEEGAGGEGSSKFQLAKSLFADFFRGEEITDVDIEGLQQLISFAASEDAAGQVVHMRVWRLVTQRSGQRLPRVELEEIGPRVDLRLRRIREADPAVLKEALKVAKGSEPRSKKNIDMDALGDKTGRIHLGRQDLTQLQTRKMKGLKRRRGDEADGAAPNGNHAAEGAADDAAGDEVDPFFDDEGEDGEDDDASVGSIASGEIEFVDEGAEDEGDTEMVTASEGEDRLVSPKRRKFSR